MSEIRVAARYAKSLFDLATERNVLDKIEEDAQGFNQVVKENRGFGNLLASPVVHSDKKWNIMKVLFGNKADKLTMEFMKIVLRKKREGVLPIIFSQFIEMYKEKRGILTATVYTAVPVTDHVISDIRQYLVKETSRQVELKTAVKEDLLGGFVLQYGDKLVDASVSSKLKELRKHLINPN